MSTQQKLPEQAQENRKFNVLSQDVTQKLTRPPSAKIWWIIDVGLALATAVYALHAGVEAQRAVLAGVSVMLAGAPLPFICSVAALLWRVRHLAAKDGAYFKSGHAVHKMMFTDTVVVNKNGIVTKGKPYVAEVLLEGLSKASLLALAASAEHDSQHPIAKAIIESANQQNARLQRLAAFSEIPHAGVEAIVNNSTVRVGTLAWLKKQKVKISAALATKSDQLASRGKIPVFVSSGQYARGIIALQDDIIPETVSVIHRLQRMGMKVIMLTNESGKTAAAVQKVTQLDGATGSLSSLGKVREIQLLRSKNLGIAMVGDTRREPEVFVAADLSVHLVRTVATTERRISKRRVETAEMEAEAEAQASLAENSEPVDPKTIDADLVLTGGFIALLPALKLAQKALVIERHNLFIAYGAALILMLLSSGLCEGIVGWWLNPWQAFVGMMGTMATLLLLALIRIST